MAGIVICCLGVLLAVYLIGGFMMNSFTDFGFWGCNNRHKFCERCGKPIQRVSTASTLLPPLCGPHKASYRCRSCGHIQVAYFYTYD